MINFILFWLLGAPIALTCLYFDGGRKLNLLQVVEAIIFSWLITLFYLIMGGVIILIWVVDKLENVKIIR